MEEVLSLIQCPNICNVFLEEIKGLYLWLAKGGTDTLYNETDRDLAFKMEFILMFTHACIRLVKSLLKSICIALL